jgi:transcriptional regulator with XRE-family HTH domain
MDATAGGRAESGSASVRALDLGARLRAERLRQGMSLREMARRLGVSPSALSQIETGKAQPSVSKLFDIVNLLNTSLDGLLAGAERQAADLPPVQPRTAPEGPAVVPREPERRPEMEGFLSVQRTGEHEVLQLDSGVEWRRLTSGSLPGVEFLHVTYEPGACSSSEGAFMRHAGQEFGYVLSGRLLVEVGFDSHELSVGDSISFPATTPHRLSNRQQEAAYAIWLVLGRHTR